MFYVLDRNRLVVVVPEVLFDSRLHHLLFGKTLGMSLVLFILLKGRLWVVVFVFECLFLLADLVQSLDGIGEQHNL